MKTINLIQTTTLLATLTLSTTVNASIYDNITDNHITNKIGMEYNNITNSLDMAIIPFAFSSDSTGLVGGLGFIKQGLLQPNTTLIASIMYGAEEDVLLNGKTEQENFSGAFISFSNYQIPYTNRAFFSFIGFKRYYPASVSYLTDSSNDSLKNDALISSGDSDFLNTTFRFVLPMGEGLDNPQREYKLKNGFAINRKGTGGGRAFETGFTSVGVKTFYQYNSYLNDDISPTKEWSTSGIRLFLDHENTDYDLNPSRGYSFEVQYSKDFNSDTTSQSWDFIEAKYSHYFNLDTFSFTQQNVLALNAWTGYSPSWDNNKQIDSGGFIDAHRPPPWEGATLGGTSKMRAYQANRFSDKAAIYATAEYRTILDWNPFRNSEYIPVAVDWLQVVAFAEIGRVNDEYNFDLLTDLKYDAGIGFRAMIAQVPVRLDIAYGDEGAGISAMIYQPFDF